MLLGRARGGVIQWTLLSNDGAAQASGGLDDGVHLAADTFARVFAASGSSLGSVIVEVAGISDLNAYAATLNYLEGMTLVRGVALEQVIGRQDALPAGGARRRRDASPRDRAGSPAGAHGCGRWSCGGSARVPLPALSADAAHSQCALHPAHVAGRAGGMAAVHRQLSADAPRVRVRGRDRRPGRFSREALRLDLGARQDPRSARRQDSARRRIHHAGSARRRSRLAGGNCSGSRRGDHRRRDHLQIPLRLWRAAGAADSDQQGEHAGPDRLPAAGRRGARQ